MDCEQFIDRVVNAARQCGYRIEINRDGLRQIDFGPQEAA